MDHAYRLAKFGNKVLNTVALFVMAILLLYGSYSLWDTYLLERGGLSGDVMKYKPSGGDMYSFNELIGINPDVVAWITIDDTNIDQPVTQSQSDDMEYVNKNALGEFSLSGAIFLSVLNSSDFSDPYCLTYGHHMENGGMYGDLPEFMEESFFNSHKTGTLYTPEKTYKLTVFGAIDTDAYDSMVYSPKSYLSGDLSGLKSYLEAHCGQYDKETADSAGQIIALSTCHDAVSNGRVVVFAKMTETEKEEVGDLQWEN